MPTLRDASSAQGVVSEGEARLPREMSRPLSRGERHRARSRRGRLAGVAMKLLWLRRFERFSVVLYLFVGLTMVVAIDPLLKPPEGWKTEPWHPLIKGARYRFRHFVAEVG